MHGGGQVNEARDGVLRQILACMAWDLEPPCEMVAELMSPKGGRSSLALGFLDLILGPTYEVGVVSMSPRGGGI